MGLRELLSAQPTLIELHASAVLSEVAALFTDKDGSVRAAAVRLLRFITQCISAERVAPFFPLLSAHLTCAMTHISEVIQEDALRVLDVLLEHYPGLLSQRHTVLLTNFLELISQKRKAGTGQDKSGKGGFALTISTSRSITAQQWRLTVLLRYCIQKQTFLPILSVWFPILLFINDLCIRSGWGVFCRQLLRKDLWRKVWPAWLALGCGLERKARWDL